MTWLRAAGVLLAGICITGCARKPAVNTAPREELRYHLEGRVVRLFPQDRVAAIRHGPIQDDRGNVWMEPMTMDFPVRDPQEFAKLRVGQEIRATVHRVDADLDFWISEIQTKGEAH